MSVDMIPEAHRFSERADRRRLTDWAEMNPPIAVKRRRLAVQPPISSRFVFAQSDNRRQPLELVKTIGSRRSVSEPDGSLLPSSTLTTKCIKMGVRSVCRHSYTKAIATPSKVTPVTVR
jgi:hypothetical protein